MRRYAVLLLVLAVAWVGCGGDEPDEGRLEPAEAMANYAATLGNADSFTFQIMLDGPPVIIDETFSLEGVDGVYRAPDSAEADVRVSVLGLTGILSLLALGEDVWQKGPLTTEWEPVVSTELLTVRDLFAPDGLGALLAEDLTGLSWQDDQALDAFPGETFRVLSGRTSGDRLGRLTLSVLDGESTDITLFVADDEVRRILLTERGSESTRTWTIDVFAYDRPVQLSPAP